MNMNRTEWETLWAIYTGKPWEARGKLGEYLKNVKIDESVPKVQETSIQASERIIRPLGGIVATNLNGTPKVEYPEYTGAPLI